MIDEKKLIEDILKLSKDFTSEWETAGILNLIHKQTKVGEWILCSEELPTQPKENPVFENKPLELYLVSVKGADYPFRAFWNGKFFTDGWTKCKAIAWMPLPASYESKGD